MQTNQTAKWTLYAAMTKNVVTPCSNALCVYPLNSGSCRKKGKYINVDQPAVMKHNNDCTGGVDIVDRAH